MARAHPPGSGPINPGCPQSSRTSQVRWTLGLVSFWCCFACLVLVLLFATRPQQLSLTLSHRRRPRRCPSDLCLDTTSSVAPLGSPPTPP